MPGTTRNRAGRLAERAGKVAGWLLRTGTVQSIPGAVGAVAVCVGLGQVYRPLMWIAAGVFLLVLDRRIPS